MSRRATFAASLALTVALIGSGVAAADTVAYPTAADASFLIDYPADWELGQGEEVGDYMSLTGPTGAELWFRTVEGNEGALKQAITESVAYLNETYSGVTLSDPQDSKQGGLEGFYATGSGKDEEGGAVVFGLGWWDLGDGNIGEIWYVAEASDKAGAAAAAKILQSFRAP